MNTYTHFKDNVHNSILFFVQYLLIKFVLSFFSYLFTPSNAEDLRIIEDKQKYRVKKSKYTFLVGN